MGTPSGEHSGSKSLELFFTPIFLSHLMTSNCKSCQFHLQTMPRIHLLLGTTTKPLGSQPLPSFPWNIKIASLLVSLPQLLLPFSPFSSRQPGEPSKCEVYHVIALFQSPPWASHLTQSESKGPPGPPGFSLASPITVFLTHSSRARGTVSVRT